MKYKLVQEAREAEAGRWVVRFVKRCGLAGLVEHGISISERVGASEKRRWSGRLTDLSYYHKSEAEYTWSWCQVE